MCPHSTKEGTIHSTWSTIELQKAKEKGYQILKIYEVFHYTPEKKHVGLFDGYVKARLKLKQESAGWLAGSETEEQKSAYLRAYKEKEGIKLENMAANPGRKASAKLMLNW